MPSRYLGNTNNPSALAAISARELYDQIAWNNNKQYFFYLTGDTEEEVGNPNNLKDYNKNLSTLAALFKIKSSEVSLVAYRSDWKTGSVYYPWRQGGQNQGEKNYYAYNTGNGIVYLCIRDAGNKLWRRDFRGKSIFNSTPTDITEFAGSDNSIWLPLYKIDSNKELSFLGEYLPLEDTYFTVKNLKPYLSNNPKEYYTAECRTKSSTLDQTGTCCLYRKESEYDYAIGESRPIGSFYACKCTKCYSCVELADRLNMDYEFTPSATDACNECSSDVYPTNCGPCQCTKTVKTDIDTLKALSTEDINSNRSANIYGRLLNNDKLGSVVSMFIDLSNLSEEARKLKLDSKGNPVVNIIIASNSGTGASWKVSYYKKKDNFFVADGLIREAVGSGYKDASITNLSDIFVNGLDLSRVELNITPLNGIIPNLGSILADIKVQILKKIRSDELQGLDTGISVFTDSGILLNPTTTSGQYVVAGGTNPNQSMDLSAVTKITNVSVTASAAPSPTPRTGKGTKYTLIKDSSGNVISNNKPTIAGKVLTSVSPDTYTLYLHSTNPSELSLFSKLTDENEGITYNKTGSTSITLPNDKNTKAIIDIGSGTPVVSQKTNVTLPGTNKPPILYSFRITLGNVTGS